MYILSAKYSDDVKGFSRHFHDAHELLYVISGRILVNVGGEEREAGEGSLLVFSRFEEHSVRVLTPEYRRFTLRTLSRVFLEFRERSQYSYFRFQGTTLVERGKGIRANTSASSRVHSHTSEAFRDTRTSSFSSNARFGFHPF